MADPRADQAPHSPPTPGTTIGGLPLADGTTCVDRGCGQPAVAMCSYVDRRPRSCAQAACMHHSRVVGGAQYCLRHAGVMDAIVDDPLNLMRKPDVDNRAPSLVAWVARDIDPGLREMLISACGPGESVVTEVIRPIVAADGFGQAWRRGWRVVRDDDTTRLLVGLEVAESRDAEVLVTVQTDTVAAHVPPWITARKRGDTLSQDETRELRAAYYHYLLEQISNAAAKNLGIPSMIVPTVRPANG